MLHFLEAKMRLDWRRFHDGTEKEAMRFGDVLTRCSLTMIVVVLAIAGQASRPLLAGELPAACLTPRAQDELWMISSRSLPCEECCPLNAAGLATKRYLPCSGWASAELDDFLHADPADAITIFFVSGNRDSRDETLEDGWKVYAALVACRASAPAMRFVIWSWPSDKITGRPLLDFRVKAERTDCEGYYLGTVITRLNPQAPLSLIGYSYGARVVSGALHLAGGGALDGRYLPAARGLGVMQARALFLAPAFDDDWLLPSHCHGLAMTQVDRLWTSYNPLDPVLKRYRLIIKRANPAALGYAGPAPGPWPLEYLDRLAAQNVSQEIGRTHWMEAYLESPPVAAEIRRQALWSP